MNNYRKINLESPIGDLQSEIKKDFKKLESRFELPLELHFSKVVEAVHKGMTSRVDYPFIKLQKSFIDYILANYSSSLGDEELNDAVEVFAAIWNHFPHDDLGMSPNEKVREEKEENPESFREPTVDGVIDDLQSEDYLEEIDEQILLLSNVAKTNLESHIKHIGGTKKDVNVIIKIFEDPEEDPKNALMYLVKMLANHSKKKNLKVSIEDIQPIVRALAMCENHIASKTLDGRHSSYMFQNIIAQVFERMEKASRESAEFVNTVIPLVAIGSAHSHIEQICSKVKARVELEEAAHHILDWLALEDVYELIRQEPWRLAVLMLGVAHLISKTADPKFVLGCSKDKIYSTLQDTMDMEKEEYEKEVAHLAEKVLCCCNDPFLMLANLIDAPDDWEQSLQKIAPCLKLRSPITMADLSIPSPL